MAAPPAQPSFNPITASIVEYLNCPHHRSVIFWLSGILQVCFFLPTNGVFYFYNSLLNMFSFKLL